MNKWAELDQFPKIKKIDENIYIFDIPIPSGMVQVNSFLIRGEKGFTVVDTGSPAKEGMEIWEQIIASGIKLEKVVLTHFHIDHLGLARWFQEKYQIPIFISDIGYQEILKRRKNDTEKFIKHLFSQHGLPIDYLRKVEDFSYFYHFEPDGEIKNGQSILLGDEPFESIWTPGHSADQFCFYNKKQEIMIVGDHILEKLSPVILIESQEDRNPLLNYFQSLETIEKYSVKQALPGHGGIMQDLSKRIEEIRLGHQHRMNQIQKSVQIEGKTAWQLTLETYNESSMGRFFSPLMATITRCIYLESIGKLYSEQRDGIIYFYATI